MKVINRLYCTEIHCSLVLLLPAPSLWKEALVLSHAHWTEEQHEVVLI